jgi:hemerythrin superfamily protein
MAFATRQSMDVLELIKSENQRINNLFNRLKTESGKQQRKLLFDNIQKALELHIYAEDQVFYPAFRNYEEAQLVVKDLVSNHDEIRLLLKSLLNLDLASVDFENRVVELMNRFDDHCAREEGEFFPLARKIMKRPERERLGRLFTATEQERESAA